MEAYVVQEITHLHLARNFNDEKQSGIYDAPLDLIQN